MPPPRRPGTWRTFPREGAGLPPAFSRNTRGPGTYRKLFNRDLSWLVFNERVLAEAADESVPPLERLRFASIVSSNLDEFFMIRVAEIARLARRDPSHRFPDGMNAIQVLAQIREHVLQQKSRQAAVLKSILQELRRQGIVIFTDFANRTGLDSEIRGRLPEIRYILRRSSEPLPALASDQIHLFVRFPREYAILTIQEREARLLELPPAGHLKRFALVERWISDCAEMLFPGREVIEAFPFKIIREADLRYRPDDEESLEEQIVEAIGRRSQARGVRLEVDSPTYSEGVLFLATALGFESAALYRFDLPLDLRTLATIYNLALPPRLRYSPIRPLIPPPLRKTGSLFEPIRKRDLLLHHPYDSFEVVVRFLQEASHDPDVTRIYHTMYRTSQESPILQALQEAARRGKPVTVYVEIKARFDELNNVRWAEELRKAGVKVVRPLGSHKVHSKVTQVFRKENGAEIAYLHLGTGNYHPGTARQYTDLGLLTANPALAQDVSAYFDSLEHRGREARFEQILAAPGHLQEQMLGLIREETKIHRDGCQGHIIAKMNSLVDPAVIQALYDASCAGVRVDLLVRGICCLRPGIQGLSRNIRVTSIVDRFLEHSRIYYFRARGAEKIYLSSADWMPRNFFTRYEIAFPIHDASLKRFLRDVVLEKGLRDNVKAWQLRPDGTYARVPRSGGPVRSQFHFEMLAGDHYRGTSLQNRA